MREVGETKKRGQKKKRQFEEGMLKVSCKGGEKYQGCKAKGG